MPDISRLLSLPTEILQVILQCLDGQEYKVLRLTCSLLQSIATSRLFESLTLYPHPPCFDRLKYVAEHEQLRHLPTKLVYDRRYMRTLHRFVSNLRRDGRFAKQWHSIMEANPFIEKFWDESTILDDAYVMVQLERYLPSLTSLKDVTVHDIATDTHREISFCNLPSFYKQMLSKWKSLGGPGILDRLFAMPAYEDDHLSFPSIMLTLGSMQNPIERLRFEQMRRGSVDDDLSKYHLQLGCSLKGLRSLVISIDGRITDTSRFELSWANHLMAMLPSKLESLSISLSTPWDVDNFLSYFWGEGEFGSSVRTMFPLLLANDGTWSPRKTLNLSHLECLNTLELSGMVCTLKELQDLMVSCSKTVRHLLLSDIELVPKQHAHYWRARSESRPCFVELFTWIYETFDLESVRLRRGFHNHGKQMFWAHPYPRPDHPMLEKVEEFIVNGGECPLDVLAIGPGMWDVGQATQRDPGLPHSHYIDHFYCGDESFQVFFYGDQEDDERIAGSR